MPLPLQVAKVIHVYGSDQKQPFVNVCWYVLASAGGGLSLTLADRWSVILRGLFTPLYEAVMTTECHYFGTSVTITDNGVAQTGASEPPVTAGTVAGDTCPDFVAWIIRKMTNVAGKRGRGRWYIGCVPEAFTDTSKLLVGPRDAECQALATAFLEGRTDPDGNDWLPAHHSAADVTLLPLQGIKVIGTLGTQRRRRFRNALG